jgi:hypothetical protein
MRAAWVAAGIAAAAVAAARPAAADTLPNGMIGLVGGARSGVAAVGPQFRVGAVWGIEAGWQPSSLNRLGYAVRWRTLFSGYWSDAPDNPATNLRVVEMDLAPYLRFEVRGQESRGNAPHFVNVGFGVSLLRSNVPLAPDDRRSYWGPYAAFGLEQFVGTSMSVTFEARVGELFTGPTTASALFGIKFGV